MFKMQANKRFVQGYENALCQGREGMCEIPKPPQERQKRTPNYELQKRYSTNTKRILLAYVGESRVSHIIGLWNYQIKSFFLVSGALKTTTNDQGVVWVYGKGH